jgi:hypothetical protein
MAAWHAKELSADAALTQIAGRYRRWAAMFETTPAAPGNEQNSVAKLS